MSPLRRLFAGFAVIASAALAGCILFTGGTGGYVVAEGGTSAGGSCKVASDCAAGQFCCYTLDAGIPSLACSSTCAAAQQACSVASDCAPRGDGGSGDGEEGDAGEKEGGTGGGGGGGGTGGGGGAGSGGGTTYECIQQTCPVEGISSVNVSTCGPISFCSQ
ncbi:MAG TPA: hypothetical protein VGG39_23815 [Polyangiaceae bacterium]|jgi:hypothetical protein